MKLARLIVISFTLASALAENPAELALLERLRLLLEKDGTIYFSNLYNDPQLDADQKRFLETLYGIFFNLPGFLKTEFEATGKIPSQKHFASSFGLGAKSVDLLLNVAEADQRLSQLFDRDPENGEITQLRMSNIDYFVQNQGIGTQITRWEGTPLPDFDLPTLTGSRLSRRDLEGRPLLIYFWFTGCPPCVRIGPHLARLSERYADRGFRVVGFNSDQIVGLTLSDDQRRDYLLTHGLTFSSVHVDQKTRQAFGNVNVFPTLFFVSDEGRVFSHMINYQELETLERTVQALLQTE